MNGIEPQVVTTPDGLPGFERARDWQLERGHPEALFSILRSLDTPGVGLLVAEPWDLAPGYEPDLPEDELARIDVTAPDQVELYVVATITEDRQLVHLNLVAPLVVHAESRLAASGDPRPSGLAAASRRLGQGVSSRCSY